MSLDLSWSLLDDEFTQQILTKLNDVLANASRPEYIGPITLESLQLGNEAPEIGIIDIGDVWEGFLQRDPIQMSSGKVKSVDRDARKGNHSQMRGEVINNQQNPTINSRGEENVRRDGNLARFANKNLPFSAVRSGSPSVMQDIDTIDGLDDDVEIRSKANSRITSQPRRRKGRGGGRRLQMYRQYSETGNYKRLETGSVSSFDTSSIPPSGIATPNPWSAGLAHSAHGGYFSAWQNHLLDSSTPPIPDLSVPYNRRASWHRQSSPLTGFNPANSEIWPPGDSIHSPGQEESEPSSTSSSLPSLQLQLSIHWTTQTLRLTLNTSLVINHPSPAFMSLPLTLTITGFSIASGGLLAFEVDPATNVRRCHFCLLEEDEEEDEGLGVGEQDEKDGIGKSDESKRYLNVDSRNRFSRQINEPPPTPGEKIVYNLTMETSVGQADKHVLKNVAKVERFVVSLVRKAIGEELVFPNFYSVELP